MTHHLNSQTDLEEAIHALVKRDPRLKPILDVAGMPSLRRREPGFVGLAHIICGQRLGLSAAKIKTLKSLARAIADERVNLDVLAEEDADSAHHTLTALHGIGPWTADVYLLFCLGHGDAWPAGDLAVQEAIRIGLGLKDRPNAKQMAPIAEPWRPMRGAAAHLWWSYYRATKKREGVIAGEDKTNVVSNIVAVAKPRQGAKIAARKEPGSKHAVNRLRRRPK